LCSLSPLSCIVTSTCLRWWAACHQRDLSQVDYVYLWADGVHFNIRLEHDRLSCLVLTIEREHQRYEARPSI